LETGADGKPSGKILSVNADGTAGDAVDSLHNTRPPHEVATVILQKVLADDIQDAKGARIAEIHDRQQKLITATLGVSADQAQKIQNAINRSRSPAQASEAVQGLVSAGDAAKMDSIMPVLLRL